VPSACLSPDRGRTIGVLVVRSRARAVLDSDDVQFLESLANLLTSSLQRAQSEEALSHAQRLGKRRPAYRRDRPRLQQPPDGDPGKSPGIGRLAAGHREALRSQLVDAAYRASRRGAELTGKLLAFSRRQVLQPLDVDVAACCIRSPDMLRRTLDQRIHIEVDVPKAGVGVLADPGQLESALLNIAINARDAMPDGGTLRFAVEESGAVPESSAPSSARRRPTDSWRSRSRTAARACRPKRGSGRSSRSSPPRNPAGERGSA
jgi:signal transduction histidine kinase